MLWFKVPPKIYFKRGAVDLAIRELKGKKRAFIVTDRYLFNSGAVRAVTDVLDEIKVDHQIFFDIKPDPSMSTVHQALEIVKPYEPDVIIALPSPILFLIISDGNVIVSVPLLSVPVTVIVYL